MGLITSMSNAVTGLRINQDSIDILSRNVANAGTPGYHRQSLNVVDYNSQNGTYARSEGVNRAFNVSLQTYYNRQVSDTASVGVVADYLSQLQSYLGKPGDAGSLDTMFGSLKNSLQSLATSPDDYTTRSDVVSHAQSLAQRLNQLSNITQELRRETETQIAGGVTDLNNMLTSLQEINLRMLDLGMTDSARASLHDQRDRLVSGIAERIDVRADYRPDGTVAIMTRSGVGLLDHGVSKFGFATAGSLSATTQASLYTDQSKVGTLTLTTPSGLTIDLVQQGILQGGELAGLVTLRDKTLVEFQNQLDEIAAGLAAVFSTISRSGEPVGPIDAPEGLKVDITGMRPGNDVLLNYSKDGVAHRVRVLNSTDGKDYVDASGQRVISVDLSDPAAAATVLNAKVPGLVFSGAADTLEVRGSTGAPGDFKVNTLVSRTTATGAAGELGLSMFTDQGQPFTNNIDTDPPQKLGFAARIAINPDLLSDNRLLVQLELGGTLGDATRPEYLLDQLSAMNFVTGGSPTVNSGKMPLNGTLGDMIGQVLNFQGTSINSTLSNRDDRQLTLDTIMDQMESEYGVNVDEEMARLMELQNAYAANARIISVVKELLDTLFAST